jgi:acetyl esterase/lipase
MPLTRRLLAGCAAALAAAGCSPFQVFNAVNPADAGTAKVGTASFGPDPRQALDVYAPAARAGAGSLPVAVLFYGGAWESGSRADYAFAGQALAAQGFVAVVPDYRLYPQVRFPDFLDDGAAAIRWVRDNIGPYGGDPARIVLVGHSAGAYNAAMLALDTRYLRRAGVDPGSVRAFAGLSGPYDFLPFDEPIAVNVFGAAPDKAATQPVTFARAGMPAFLATGDRDTRVRPRNTASLAAKLRQAGGRVEERVYPGLDHADTLLALSVLFRGKAPVLAELAAFLLAEAGARPR